MENNSYNNNDTYNNNDKVCCNTNMNNGMNNAYHGHKCCIMTWFLAMVAAFVVMMAFDWVYNGILLKPMFEQFAALWRPEADMQAMWPWCIGIHLVMSAAFACLGGWVCTICDGKCPIRKGAMLGLKIGFLLGAAAMGLYVLLPISFDMGLAFAVGALVKSVLVGTVIGMIYKMKMAKHNVVHIEQR